jgi:adenylate cyclase
MADEPAPIAPRRRLQRLIPIGLGPAPAPMALLPQRVNDAIRKQQDDSERLIGWIQLLVVVTFGTLYALTPKTFTSAAAFAPVPYALVAYSVFTLLRLGLAYRGRLPGWLLSLSVVMDMALLLGLIWSFHLQYDQPPSFYLKAPTLLYVFIFIALRALRFEARYVVMSGLVAAVGWGFMIAYVVVAEAGNPMITRDYVTYLTSNSILLGAEFDKIISIVVVTLILALAIYRARRLLVRAVAAGAAQRDLARFFAPEIAARITAAERQVMAGEGELREAAILTIDIRGFTRLAERLPPNEVIALLTEYHARIVPIIARHGGSVDKFLGDGILATFGAAVPSETYAADALKSADAVIAEGLAWAEARRGAGLEPLALAASATTGRVVFGAVGDAERLEYTVIGDAVNLAAKLDKHSKVEHARGLTTAEAHALAVAQGYVPPEARVVLAGRAVEGVAAPVDIVVLAES